MLWIGTILLTLLTSINLARTQVYTLALQGNTPGESTASRSPERTVITIAHDAPPGLGGHTIHAEKWEITPTGHTPATPEMILQQNGFVVGGFLFP